MRLGPLVTLAFITFALGFGELMIAGILPSIAAGTRTSIPLAGQLVTVYALTFAALSPPLAIALRRTAAKRVLIASLIVVAAANLVAAAAHAFALLVAARVAAATGSAVATPLALAAIDQVAAEDVRGRAHGIVFTGFSLAAMLGVPLGALIAAQFSWRWTFASVGALAACAALATIATIPAGAAASTPYGPLLRRTIARPRVRQTLIVSALCLTAQYTAYTYFRPYFVAASGAGVTDVVWLFFLFGGFGIAGTLLGGLAIDRYGPRPTMLLALAGCGVTFAVLPLASRTLPGASVAVAAWALTSWGFGPAVNRQLDLYAGAARDVALAFNLTAFNIGIAAGSALGGAAIELAGIGSLPWVAAALCAVAILTAAREPP